MSMAAEWHLALVGSPNCGKTALFNRLTGSRQKVANYAGVTVERKEGRFQLPNGRAVRLLDLPGAYSFAATSPDEQVTFDVCRGQFPGEKKPDLLVCVADATNLRLHLRFILEVRNLGQPMLLALNMVDAAKRRGIAVDAAVLARELGIPVVETVAIRRGGADALQAALTAFEGSPTPPPKADDLHAETRRVMGLAVREPERSTSFEERADRILLNPWLGLPILAGVLFLMFQAVFAWAGPMQDALAGGTAAAGHWLAQTLPAGALQSLITDGIFAGLGTVLEFLPQILLLFLFILLLEESGYLPRAAFLLDRLMAGAGLTGRSFIPLLSSFACAIPGIMATRSIQNPRDRLVTIMIAPLMTCSARLPVYTLLIGAFIPRQEYAGGWLNLQGLVLFGLYVTAVVSAMVVSFIMKRWHKKAGEQTLLLELPAYRWPNPLDVAIGLWERAMVFLRRVTTIILALTVLLWFLASFPAPPEGATGPAIDYSFAGRIGHALQWFFAPIGFNWQICIALIPGLAAREVAVSALATVYAVAAASDEQAISQLTGMVAGQWSIATGLSLLVWYIYAPMCLSTIAVIRRETGGWKHPLWATVYLFALAYFASFLTYQVASALLT
ncbi:ferrous iron transporter B [Ahniella affigens]|uniref:Ferrous iron transport protein B n=1 Tax=Ahniella affigens TaxID=2021234 RepID=A0A2P1PWA7_9GAMM|nr:ferrous iron transporter B [Ahniella affigens]AVP99141.1 ferrous iron transporter B [Ahniella affigens]